MLFHRSINGAFSLFSSICSAANCADLWSHAASVALCLSGCRGRPRRVIVVDPPARAILGKRPVVAVRLSLSALQAGEPGRDWYGRAVSWTASKPRLHLHVRLSAMDSARGDWGSRGGKIP